jgi:hypothetical protein
VQFDLDPENGAIRTGRAFCLTITLVLRRDAEIGASVAILARDLATVVAIMNSEPRQCGAGRHVFRFRVKALPLMPGLFHVRGAMREGERLIPLETFGFKEAPRSFFVGGEPSLPNVHALAYGQLLHLEGEWE